MSGILFQSSVNDNLAYEVNGRQVISEEFYEIACNPKKNVCVEACAGSGKTWMLVSRMVRALLDSSIESERLGRPWQPQAILAITFTKRAATEMRERLYHLLEKFSKDTPAQLQEELRLRGVDTDKNSKLSKQYVAHLSKLHTKLLTQGLEVQVRTFHSWFASLLRSAPLSVLFQLNLPTQYDLLEDDAKARALVWEIFYKRLIEKPELRNDFESLVTTYGRSQTDKALRAVLDKRTEFVLADRYGIVGASVPSFKIIFPTFCDYLEPYDAFTKDPLLNKALWMAAKKLGQATQVSFSKQGIILEKSLTKNDPEGVVAALFTKELAARKFSSTLLGIDDIRLAQESVDLVMRAQLQHKAWIYQQQMANLSRCLLEEFSNLKREHGWVDMTDLELAASLILSDPVLSGWIQEKLDAAIKYLMIDEFQDTNPLQWQALSSWLSSYAGAGSHPPSLFLVGDPKQSIYRFRRAEPQVFKSAQKFVQDVMLGDLLNCDHTRRNASKIIHTINSVMKQLNAENLAPGFRAHTTNSTDRGEVLCLPQVGRGEKFRNSKAEEDLLNDDPINQLVWRDSLITPRFQPELELRVFEAQQAATWIDSRLHSSKDTDSVQAKDIIVLSRTRAGLVSVQKALRERKIPAVIGEKLTLIDCCEIQDLVALMDFLISPQDNLSLARILKSPIFSFNDDLLVQLRLESFQSTDFWWDSLLRLNPVDNDGRVVCEYLSRWKIYLTDRPPHDALNTIYLEGDFVARFSAAVIPEQRESIQSNLSALLNSTLSFNGGRFSTPYTFVRALKAGSALAPAVVNQDAIRLLTIHGAKGLEAEIVLLLDTDTPERSADSMSVLIDWPGQSSWPEKFIFLSSEKFPPECALDLMSTESLARKREESNALYVAMTRAKKTLCISSIQTYRSAPGSWWKRLQPFSKEEDCLPSICKQLSIGDSNNLSDENFSLLTIPELILKENEFTDNKLLKSISIFSLDNHINDSDLAKSSLIGLAMHRFLEWGQVDDLTVDILLNEFSLTISEISTAKKMAINIWEGQGSWAWNSNELLWSGNEVEVFFNGENLRIDRLVACRNSGNTSLEESTWWVLDYKSSDHPHKSQELCGQLLKYRLAVQSLYPKAKIRAAFLTSIGSLIELKNVAD